MFPFSSHAGEVSPDKVPMKLKIIILVIGVILLGASYFVGEAIKAQKSSPWESLDSRMQLLQSLRAEKQSNNEKIDDLKQKNFLLDERIVPLKCSLFSDVTAGDQWEIDCRDFFEGQQSRIENPVVE